MKARDCWFESRLSSLFSMKIEKGLSGWPPCLPLKVHMYMCDLCDCVITHPRFSYVPLSSPLTPSPLTEAATMSASSSGRHSTCCYATHPSCWWGQWAERGTGREWCLSSAACSATHSTSRWRGREGVREREREGGREGGKGVREAGSEGGR